ncbi:MAG: hypothetical protein J07AB43_09090 [Candidatus Nanosalina sp. J07AB43]|nr:MAG: hypothetical protein J07AB43_09090 [Candidatus Nanosalina sp. J07AB43]
MKYIQKTLENSRDERINLEEEIKGFNSFMSSIGEKEPEGAEYVQIFYENVWQPTKYSDINGDTSISTKRDIVENFLIEYGDIGSAVLNEGNNRTDFIAQDSSGSTYTQHMKQKTRMLINERDTALQNLSKLIDHLENSHCELESIESRVKSVDANPENWADVESAWNRLSSSSEELSNYLKRYQSSGRSFDRDLTKLVGADTHHPVMSDVGVLKIDIEEKKSSLIKELPVETS